MVAIDDVLKQRSRTHGSFIDNACIALTLRRIFRESPNWNNLMPAQQLALEEMALKQARILSAGGAAYEVEHWNDIAGYATLGAASIAISAKKEP